MAKSVTLDLFNQRVVLGVSAGTDTEYSVQELGSLIKEELQKAPFIDDDKIFTWSGFDVLPLGDRTGVVMILQNAWTIWAGDQGSPHNIRLSKGIISRHDLTEPLGSPTNVSWKLADSTVSSLSNSQTIENNQRAIEFQNISSGTGVTFYWHPNEGDDDNNGLSEDTAVKTFVKAHSLCVSGRGDVIIVEEPDYAGVYTVTESLVISKNNIHLRGTGRNIILKSADDTKPTVNISGNDCELSNLEIQSASTGTNNSVTITGYRAVLNRLFITEFTGSAIDVDNSKGCKFVELKVIEGTGIGFRLNNVSNSIIEDCDISQCGTTGIYITADSQPQGAHNILRKSLVHECDGYQIRVGTNVWDFVITPDSFVEPIGSGRIEDFGIVTIDEDQSHHMRTAVNAKISIETLRPDHSGFGETYYWDPYDGDDLETGITKQMAVKTWARVLAVVSNNNNDTVIILSRDPSGVTTITENITLSKNFMFLRGAGRNVKFQPTSGVPITITGNGCEVSSVEISGVGASGTSFGVDITSTANFTLLKDLYIHDTKNIAINLVEADNCRFENCIIENSAGAGAICVADSEDTRIIGCKFTDSTNDGVYVTSTAPNLCKHTTFTNCKSINNSGYAVHIVNSDVLYTTIDPQCQFTNVNGLGRINDQGTNTVDQEIAFRTVAIYEDIGHSSGGRSLDR